MTYIFSKNFNKRYVKKKIFVKKNLVAQIMDYASLFYEREWIEYKRDFLI